MLRILLLLVMLLGCARGREQNDGPPKPGDTWYGQNQIAEYNLDLDTIARFMQHQPSKPGSRESPVEAVLLADTEDWRGPVLKAGAGRQPHRLVVTLSATAISDGDARSMWQAGWRDAEGQSKLVPFSGLGKREVQAGQQFVVTAGSPAMFLQEGRDYQAELALVKLDNLKLNSVNVQIWTGIGDASPMQAFFSLQWVWIGGLMMLLWWWLRRP